MTVLNQKLIFILFFLIASVSHAQTQKGIDIDGESAYDQSGQSVSLSADGNTIAIGAPTNQELGSPSGHVRIYSWDGAAWVQKGSDIDAESSGDKNGYSVSISSDGNIVAIGAPWNDGGGSDSGHVRIYEWDGSSWIQKGLDIDGASVGDNFGNSVSLSSDGNTIAIGAPSDSGIEETAGYAQVYYWDGSAWIQKGLDFIGEFIGDRCGWDVALNSDGNTVAIGSPFHDGEGYRNGQVRIYTWDGSEWIQKGFDIDSEGYEDHSGNAVSLSSDGNTIAIAAHISDAAGTNAGRVRIFIWSGLAWMQRGIDINGEMEFDRFGQDLSISSDGNTVAIGADVGSAEGNVRVFNWIGLSWIQKGIQLYGELDGDRSGESVSIDSAGNVLAIGAPFNDGAGTNSGHVRVYEYCDNKTNSIDVLACTIYTVPSGDEEYTMSGVYMDTIPRGFICGDSILTINLSIITTNVDVSVIATDTLQADLSGVGITYQWIYCKDSSEIAGATSQTFGALTNGNYAVIINNNGCIDTSECYAISGVGIIKNQHDEIKIYPNPSTNFIYFESDNATIETIKLYNSLGQIVMSLKLQSNKTELDFGGLERGIYTVLIQTSIGQSQQQIILQ